MRSKERIITKQNREFLRVKLLGYKDSYHQDVTLQDSSHQSLILEFTDFHVDQVLRKCHLLFELDDVLSHVEILRMKHAVNILTLINEVFGDVNVDDVTDFTGPAAENMEEELEDQWVQLRDDSCISIFNDFEQMEDVDQAMEVLDQSGKQDLSLSNIIDFNAVKTNTDYDETMDTI